MSDLLNTQTHRAEALTLLQRGTAAPRILNPGFVQPLPISATGSEGWDLHKHDVCTELHTQVRGEINEEASAVSHWRWFQAACQLCCCRLRGEVRLELKCTKSPIVNNSSGNKVLSRSPRLQPCSSGCWGFVAHSQLTQCPPLEAEKCCGQVRLREEFGIHLTALERPETLKPWGISVQWSCAGSI